MEVLRPKELDTHPGEEIVLWARGQLEIAGSILDNPGGGLLFATQTIGQVKAGLHEDAAVRREFDTARRLLGEAVAKLSTR